MAVTGVFLPPQALSAASDSASLTVSATVVNNCTINTGALVFGSYDPVVANASASLDGTGTVTIACTKGANTTVGLNTGSNALLTERRMADGSSNHLTYELYQDASRSAVWTNAGAGILTPTAAPSKAARTFNVYGRVPANQDVPAGAYTDTITATVNF
ncbi:MAG: Csu type fimbrial protein [Vicinamibacterales bacterium]